jgi:hypothetical protein
MKTKVQASSKSQYDTDQERLVAKRKELAEIHATLDVYFGMGLSPRAGTAISVLQERLEYRTMQAELQLLEDKIALYGEALTVARNDKMGV